MSSTLSAMDFSSVGTTERVSDAFRAHVNLRINGQQRNAYGPRRPDEAAAKEDLESMRAAVTGDPPLLGVLSLYPFGIKEGP